MTFHVHTLFRARRTHGSGQLSTCCLLDRLLGRLSSYLRGDFIEGIDDHAISEYARHFKQAVINSKVPVLHKAVNVVNDAVGHVSLKVTAVIGNLREHRRRFWGVLLLMVDFWPSQNESLGSIHKDALPVGLRRTHTVLLQELCFLPH